MNNMPSLIYKSLQDVTWFNQTISVDDGGNQNKLFYDRNQYLEMISLVAKCKTMNMLGLEGSIACCSGTASQFYVEFCEINND
jgi:hypothetical protein